MRMYVSMYTCMYVTMYLCTVCNLLLLLINTEQTSTWMAWLRHAQEKSDHCEK